MIRQNEGKNSQRKGPYYWGGGIAPGKRGRRIEGGIGEKERTNISPTKGRICAEYFKKSPGVIMGKERLYS